MLTVGAGCWQDMGLDVGKRWGLMLVRDGLDVGKRWGLMLARDRA